MSTPSAVAVRESAPAKVNLLLQVGPRRAGGLHELCSLFACVELADTVEVRPAERDELVCPGVRGPNLAAAAVELMRSRLGSALPPLRVSIHKRIPVAAGLGGGSADAAAVLRAANELAGAPLAPGQLRALGSRLGSDVPSQVEPRHALVTGAGEGVEPVGLPSMTLVLLPQREGLTAREVYGELDRLRGTRPELDPAAARRLASLPLEQLARALENDLEHAVLSLRPQLREAHEALARTGALRALVTGSGPTVVGLFADRRAAEAAASALPGAIVTELRSP